MSYALRKPIWDAVVQWRGDNLEEVKRFVEENLPAGSEVNYCDDVLLIDSFDLSGECEYTLLPTDWLIPSGGEWRRLFNCNYDNFYEREPI